VSGIPGVGDHIFSEGPVYGIASVLCFRAQSFPPGDAPFAFAARAIEPSDAGAVAFLEGVHGVADRNHLAHAFMPWHKWELRLHWPVAVRSV
jgi:hypothetical protein